MKKIVKIFFMTALILVLVGGIFSIAGYAAGGRRQFEDMVWNNEFVFPFYGEWGSYSYNYTGIDDDDWEGSEVQFKQNQMIHMSSDFSVDLNHELDMTDVSGLDIEIGGSVLYIERSDDREYHLNAANVYKLQYYVENGTLVIRAENKHKNWKNQDYTEIYLYIPEGKEFTVSQIGVGAGEIFVDDLNVGNMDLNVGVGSIQFERMKAEHVTLNLGMGETTISEGTVKSMDYEVGMGSLNYTGSITGNMNGDCSMGTVMMELSGKESDHNYEIEASMGTVTLDGSSYSGLSSERIINNGSDSQFDITCSMGSIDIYFTNSL